MLGVHELGQLYLVIFFFVRVLAAVGAGGIVVGIVCIGLIPIL